MSTFNGQLPISMTIDEFGDDRYAEAERAKIIQRRIQVSLPWKGVGIFFHWNPVGLRFAIVIPRRRISLLDVDYRLFEPSVPLR